MKHVILVLTLLMAYLSIGQNPLTKDVGEFFEVKVYDLIEVNLIKSEDNKVVISGEDIQDVEIVNKNGKLKIRMKLDKIFHGENTFVEVYYNSIETIDGNEGAFIVSNELIEQDEIVLKSQEGARIKVGLEVDKLEVRAVTGGIVETRGKANHQDIVLNTGGIYKGKHFETETTNVKIQAAGEAEVNTFGKVDATVRAGGEVFIYGNPKTVNETTILGGKIRYRDL